MTEFEGKRSEKIQLSIAIYFSLLHSFHVSGLTEDLILGQTKLNCRSLYKDIIKELHTSPNMQTQRAGQRDRAASYDCAKLWSCY